MNASLVKSHCLASKRFQVKVGNYVPICHMNFYTIFSIHKALWATTASDGEMLQLFRLYPKAVGKLLDENATAWFWHEWCYHHTSRAADLLGDNDVSFIWAMGSAVSNILFWIMHPTTYLGALTKREFYDLGNHRVRCNFIKKFRVSGTAKMPDVLFVMTAAVVAIYSFNYSQQNQKLIQNEIYC